MVIIQPKSYLPETKILSFENILPKIQLNDMKDNLKMKCY